jgi:hypothetical protein
VITHPTAPQILQAVIAWLEQSQPARTGQDAYLALVARNALGTVLRELQQSPEADAASRARLQTLLGKQGSLADLERELVARLRDATIAYDDPHLLAHLGAQTADNLSIDQPRYKAAP